MKTEWALDPIYKGLDDPAYEADMQAVEKLIAEFAKAVKEAGAAEECTEKLLLLEEELVLKISRLGLYLSLRQSVEAENGEVMAQDSRLMKMYSQLMPFTAAADKIFAKIEDIDALAKTSEVVKEYTFLLKQAKEHAKYLLSDDV